MSGSNTTLAITSSGTAMEELLLEGGRMGHVTFKLPLKVCNSDTNICNIAKQSNTVKLIQNVL